MNSSPKGRLTNHGTLTGRHAHFGAQRGFCSLNQRFRVVYVNKHAIADLVQVLYGDAGSLLIAVGDADWVDASVQQLLSFLQQGTSQDCEPQSRPSTYDARLSAALHATLKSHTPKPGWG